MGTVKLGAGTAENEVAVPRNRGGSRVNGVLRQARKRLSYDLETGVFTHVENSPMCDAGAEAGSVRKNGYRYIYVLGRRYTAQRLAWLFIHGEWPKGRVRHVDGNRDNNSAGNIVEVKQ